MYTQRKHTKSYSTIIVIDRIKPQLSPTKSVVKTALKNNNVTVVRLIYFSHKALCENALIMEKM
jgi:hypothetical protein